MNFLTQQQWDLSPHERVRVRVVFVSMQKDQSSKDIMKAKVAFKLHAKMHGLEILAYNSDNGRFSNNHFMDDEIIQRQQVSY